MVPTLGRTLILLALLAASVGSIVGFATGARPGAAGWKWARRLAYAFAAFMALANLTMEYALLTHDFSVSYVAHVGSRAVPTWVSIVSLWSSLEGSILFWGLVMGVYVSVATWRKAGDHPEYMPYAVGVWLACGAFFSFLLAGPAQPFATVPNPALDGPGPNPLLQNHYLMVIHPPFLYSGYVGMTIPFGLACAALLVGRLGNDFIRPLRNFLLVSWIFLTCAIVLGGWWAYEVLGWGGHWAWAPVENASSLPWLTATAALHSAMLVERKGVLKGWTVILVLATYLLTILGTFMTRSGVFNSVHSFTQSAIGPTILVFLAAALLFSLVLLALRVDSLGSEGRLETGPSRDVMFLVQNLLFVLFTAQVTVSEMFLPVRQRMRARGEGLAEAFRQAQSRGRRRFGAYIVHAGAVVVIAAIAVSSTMGSSKEVQLNQGETTALGAYQLTFLGAQQLSEPHRQSVLARVDVSKNGRSLGTLLPRMSQYENQREPIGSPAVHTGLTEDLYLSIHNIDGPSVGLLVLINPMVSWIWIATAIMALGRIVALVPSLRGSTAAAPAAGTAAVALEGSS